MGSSSRSNVGGVFSVEMWLAKDSGRGDPPTSLDDNISSISLPVISSQSQYVESVIVNGGITKVEHTLTITTEAKGDFWGEESVDEYKRVGCVAEVEVSSYGKITLGWSQNLGYDQPLRLTKVTTQSSDSVNQSCTKKWVFKSYSTTPLLT